MLKALYDYGIKNGLAIPPGFTPKAIRAYIVLSKQGDFLGIEQPKNETQICPDIGSLANGPGKCNPVAEKAEIILAVSPQQAVDAVLDEKEAGKVKKQWNNIVKKHFFHTMLASSSRYVPMHGMCLQALENDKTFCAICEAAKRQKIKGLDRISFRIDGTPAMCDPKIAEWWAEFRNTLVNGGGNAGTARCLITGEIISPLATVPPVSGLQTVGGNASGTPLFCFDKNAFQSYGLKQSANAPVSEEAFVVVKNALNDLLNGAPAMYNREKRRNFNPTAPVFAGMKFVHWYDEKINPEDDSLAEAFDTFEEIEEDDMFDSISASDAYTDEEIVQSEEHSARREMEARKIADKAISSLQSGEKVPLLPHVYHILLMSGANGRAMVRYYEQGNYEALQKNLGRWYEDISLCDNMGTATLRPNKLAARFIRLMPRQKGERNVFDRMKKELAGLTPSIIMAIIHGSSLPDAVASRALSYIRSQMIDPDEKDPFGFMPDGIACQWLKVWLRRKARMRNEEVSIMPFYDNHYPNAAYHCGAIVAIYADIQRTAMPDVGAGIVQRYYASASRTPALVLGTLERLSKYHLDKVKSAKYYYDKIRHSRRYIDKVRCAELIGLYEELLNEAYLYFDGSTQRRLPSVLNLEEQSYFALGYRQMSAKLNADVYEIFVDKSSSIEADKEEA